LAYRATFSEGSNARPKPTASDCALLVDRFITAPSGASIGPKLAFETRKLAWVLGGEELHALQGLKAGEVAARLKFGRTQEQAVLAGTQQMRVYLLPAADGVLCEWDPFLDLVGKHYGPKVAARLDVHRSALRGIPYAEIQDADPAFNMAALDIAYAADRWSSPAVYTASANRLVDARAFLYHELGLNEHADLTAAHSILASAVAPHQDAQEAF
jgi:hypothetical protein